MAPVEALAVHTVDVTHQQRQVGAAGVQHEVVVVAHEAIRQHLRIKTLQPLGHHAQQRPPIYVVHKDAFPPVPTRSDVVQGSSKLNTQWAGHRVAVSLTIAGF
jgi:hypothetical protein